MAQQSERIVSRLEDGQVVIYERLTAKTPNFFYRIKVPGQKNYYERRTTGKTDLKEAEAVALSRYADMTYAQKKGLSISMPTFRDLCRIYLKHWKRLYEVDGDIVERTYLDKKGQIEQYLIPFFGDLPADELTQEAKAWNPRIHCRAQYG